MHIPSIEPEGRLSFLDRQVGRPRSQVNGSQRGPRFDQVGVEFHRLCQLAASLRHVVLGREGEAEELVGRRGPGLVLNHRLQQLDSLIRLPPSQPEPGIKESPGQVFLVLLENGFHSLLGLIQFPDVEVVVNQLVAGEDGSRVDLHRLLVAA